MSISVVAYYTSILTYICVTIKTIPSTKTKKFTYFKNVVFYTSANEYIGICSFSIIIKQ